MSAADDALLQWLRRAVVAGIREGELDLNLRQTAVFLTVYLTDKPQTVRGLADRLAVNKPAITGGFDGLGNLDLLRRIDDPRDRRGAVAQRTAAGTARLERLKASLAAAAVDGGGAGVRLRNEAGQ